MSLASRKLVACAKIGPKGANWYKTALKKRKGLGRERFSETSRIPKAKRESPSNYMLYERLHDGKIIFSPRVSRKTCHTFQKRVIPKILCLECKLDNKSRCLYFGSLRTGTHQKYSAILHAKTSNKTFI